MGASAAAPPAANPSPQRLPRSPARSASAPRLPPAPLPSRRRLAAPPAAGPAGICSSRRGPTGMHLEQRNGERTGREREEGKGGREREIQMWERDSEGGALGPHVTVMKKIDRSLQNLRLSVKSSLGWNHVEAVDREQNFQLCTDREVSKFECYIKKSKLFYAR